MTRRTSASKIVLLWGLASMVLAACSAPAAPPAATAAPPPTSAPPALAPSKAPAPPASSPAALGAPSPAVSPVTATSPGAAPVAGGPLTGPPIKIGVMDDLTGIGSIEGSLLRISVDVVINDINTTGGINGRPVEAVFVDPKGDAAQALALATQLAQQDQVDVLAGAIFSPECLGVSGLAVKFGLAYVPLNGCASDQLTAKNCNKYTFRAYPVANQVAEPAIHYEVQNFGKKWGIIYPDYALGQSTVATDEAALTKEGATLSVKIPVPLGETNITPFVTRIPTDGSIEVLVVAMTGSDLARVMSVMQQFGILKKVKVITGLGKESFGGVYPDAMTGAIITGLRPSDGIPGNADDAAYMQKFRAMAQKDAAFTAPLGGPDKASPGNQNGYNVYISMNMLKIAMRQSGFTGKADTDKLIATMEKLTIPQGPDAPNGPMIMNPADHQGRITEYLMQIEGQTERVLQTFPADTLPLIGTCKIA